MLLKVFLVFYTASGGVASVSKPIDNIGFCESIAITRNANNLKSAKTDADVFVAECEQHKKPPKVTVKIDRKTREMLEVNCIERGLPQQCEDLPNGDLAILTSARDRRGNRLVTVIKPKAVSVTSQQKTQYGRLSVPETAAQLIDNC